MAEESIAEKVEAGLKPRKCSRCRAEYTLFERTDGDACCFDDCCPKCTVRAALKCAFCVSRGDWRYFVRGLKEFLDEMKLEE